MKKSSMLLIAAALVLSSCGTAALSASSDNGQRFQDGIYGSSPSFRSKAEKAEERAETEALAEKTKASEIYLFGDRKDTIMLADNQAARIQYDRNAGSTVVTVTENPYHVTYELDFYYPPYSVGSAWYWSRHYDPWYWNTWSYTPWRYHGWYDPFYVGGWYDPWYYAGFHDPWYYGGWGWNHWYGYYNHPHYCGWYGGWYPHHGHGHFPHHGHGHFHDHGHIHDKPGGPGHNRHLRGQRYQTGSQRVFGSSASIRGGSSVRSTTGRSTSAVSGTTATRRANSSGISSGRTVTGRSTATKVTGASSIRNTMTAGTRSAVGTSSGGKIVGTYRKPSTPKGTAAGANLKAGSTSSSSQGTVSRSSSSGSSRSSSSSYNRSSSSSSGSSFSRSSGSSGGSFSRSGSSGVRRR